MNGLTITEIARQEKISRDAVSARIKALKIKPIGRISNTDLYTESAVSLIMSKDWNRGRPSSGKARKKGGKIGRPSSGKISGFTIDTICIKLGISNNEAESFIKKLGITPLSKQPIYPTNSLELVNDIYVI